MVLDTLNTQVLTIIENKTYKVFSTILEVLNNVSYYNCHYKLFWLNRSSKFNSGDMI